MHLGYNQQRLISPVCVPKQLLLGRLSFHEWRKFLLLPFQQLISKDWIHH